MAQNAKCTEDGPFFPTTPRYVTQNGIAINQDILKEPDWLVILLLLLAVLLVMILIILALVNNCFNGFVPLIIQDIYFYSITKRPNKETQCMIY